MKRVTREGENARRPLSLLVEETVELFAAVQFKPGQARDARRGGYFISKLSGQRIRVEAEKRR